METVSQEYHNNGGPDGGESIDAGPHAILHTEGNMYTEPEQQHQGSGMDEQHVSSLAPWPH